MNEAAGTVSEASIYAACEYTLLHGAYNGMSSYVKQSSPGMLLERTGTRGGEVTSGRVRARAGRVRLRRGDMIELSALQPSVEVGRRDLQRGSSTAGREMK